MKRPIDWLKEHYETEFQLLCDIWLYVWIGTCDLTSRDSSTGYITLTSTRDESIIEKISEGYQEIAKILQNCPACKLTFLETPFYSIAENNRHRVHITYMIKINN